ncbi:MAG: hypothetical protein AAF226_01795 [Verrucomicrobiota bacterium]
MVLTVLAILVGAAIPSIDGVLKEREAREPIDQLAMMARDVRNRALAEDRPYQIVFTGEGFQATRFFNPYGGLEEFDQLKVQLDELARRREMIEASEQRSGVEVVEGAVEDIYYQSYEIDPSLDYSLLSMKETDWVPLTSGGNFHRWIFQSSGMCDPLKIRMQSDNAFFEVEFHPLTAEIKDENSWVE